MYENVEESKFAYAAGLIDGEGSISVGRSAVYVYVRLSVGMRCLHAVKFMQVNFGGAEPRFTGVGVWTWNLLESDKLVAFLARVLPYLQVKRRQAELAIALAGLCKPVGTNHSITEKELLMRLRLGDMIKECNSEWNQRSKNQLDESVARLAAFKAEEVL